MKGKKTFGKVVLILAFVFMAWYVFDNVFGVIHSYVTYVPQAFDYGYTAMGISLIGKGIHQLLQLAVAVFWLMIYMDNREEFKLPSILTVGVLGLDLLRTILFLALNEKSTNVLEYVKESYYTCLIMVSWIILLSVNKKAGKIIFAALRWLLLGISLIISFIRITRSNLSFIRGGVDKSEVMILLSNTYSVTFFALTAIMTALLVLYIFRPKIFLKD